MSAAAAAVATASPNTLATMTIAERNVANAQHSTGPVTAEGKDRSSRNALRHGLTGRTVVLPHESHEEYEALKAEFIREHTPGTALEVQLLVRMVDSWWRLSRAMRVEAELLEQRGNAIAEADPNLAGDAAFVSLFFDPAESQSFRLFMRYLANAQNTWRTACAEYQQTHKGRVQREQEELMLQAMREARRNNYGITDENDEDAEEDGDAAVDETEKEPEPESYAAAAAPSSKPDPQQQQQQHQSAGFVSHRDILPEPPRPFPGAPTPRS